MYQLQHLISIPLFGHNIYTHVHTNMNVNFLENKPVPHTNEYPMQRFDINNIYDWIINDDLTINTNGKKPITERNMHEINNVFSSRLVINDDS